MKKQAITGERGKWSTGDGVTFHVHLNTVLAAY